MTSELKLRNLLERATFFIKNSQEDETFIEKCKVCLDEADIILRQNTRESFLELSAEVIIMFVEVSLLTNTRDADAQRVLDIFFQRFTQEDQFFCRGLLAYATVEERKIVQIGMKAEDNLKQVLLSFSYIKRALDIATKAENKQKYQFVVYNASIKTWHIIRPLIKPQWSKNFVEFVEKISNLLEEVDDSDFNWRCRYLNVLVKAMVDADKKPEALKVLDKLWDLTKKKGECKFQETLFRNRIHLYRDNNGVLGNIKKETETGPDPNAYKQLYVIQSIKSGIIPDVQVEKELTAVMASLSPSSVTNDPNALQQASKISPIFQDRLAECGRLAIKYNLIALTEGACNVIVRARQGSLRAKVWTEYSKAELLLKKPPSEIDTKTGMKLNTLQKQIEDYERRVEALKVLDRVMIANKRLQDADIITEGSTLIWNIGIPLLKKSARSQIQKPFQSACTALESIQSNDSVLRVCLHLELAKYEIERDYLQNAKAQLKKSLDIDYSLTIKQIPGDLKEDDDPGDFQRPYQKLLNFLFKKLQLKTNLYGGDPDNIQDQIIIDVENAKTTKNTKMRETLLGKALKDLMEFEEPDFEVDPALDLVEEEIKQAQRKFHLATVRSRKERVLIAAEIASLAMEECLFDIAFKSASLAVSDEWDPIKNADLVIAQSQSNFILAQCYVEQLLEDEIEIGFKDLFTVEEDQDEREFTNEERSKYHEWKIKFPFHIIQGVRQGQLTQQTWLIFNGAIDYWNNYLPVFRKSNYYELLLPEGVPALVECFEGMNNCFINAAFNSESIDYELDKKMQVFTNLSVMLARLYEFNVKNDDAVRVCDILLQKQLPSHLRKTFDSIKARVTKQVSNLATLGQAKGGAAPAKGKDPVPAATNVYQPSKTDILTSEILSYLELIQNGNKELINKAMETLNTWAPNQLEEIELELNAELWCRLGRLAINVNTNAQIKVGLFCSEQCLNNACQQYKKKNYNSIPVTRLRWYSVGESLYGEALFKLLDTQKQEKESQDRLLHMAVSRFVEACSLGARANISFLVLEGGKLMWNALIPLLESPHNRKLLIKPMSMVHDFLKQVHESSDPDFLVLFYSALFECIREQRDWKLGEQIVEEAFMFVPQTHQKVLWEAKMLFLSKLGKNVLNAISNMKESNASLMAKVWVKLARSSANQLEQHSAYNKAIEILRKEESVEVVEVLIEYAEWLQRNKYATQDIEDQLLLGVDILMDYEPGWGDDEDEEELQEGDQQEEAKTRKTGKSKSSKLSKGSKAQTKKSNLKSKAGGKSMKSKVSKRSASMRSKTGSRVSKKTTTALSKRQEEESQPMFLNCSHFEKLVRIHSMMAMVAPDSHKQREYALDAHYFIMKLWEQTFQTLNAHIFFEEHKAECEELGFKFDQQESRRQFFMEALTNNELGVPTKFVLPEKPEDWINFSVPEPLLAKSNGHEDKLMVSKWTFIKPELTFFHLENVASILEEHYFSIQLLPVLELLSFFGRVVLEDRKIEDISLLKKGRLMMNLGLKQEGEGLKTLWEQTCYKLTDDEKKLQLEKIKGLKDPNDNLKDKAVDFPLEEPTEPLVLEQIKIHEIWLQYGQELLKWGEFIKAKEFILEVNIHSRILKDQEIYSQSLMLLSTIAFLEGESASALKCDMLCHQYAKSMGTVERAVEHTFDLLLHFGKLDDCRTLIDPSIKMLGSLYDQWNAQGLTHGGATKGSDPTQNNLPLEYAIGTINILKAILSLKEAQQLKAIEEQQRKIDDSFSYIEKYDIQQTRIGFKHSQLLRLLQLSQILSEDVGKSSVQADVRHVDLVKSKLEKNASILLKVQEIVTNQVYFIGVHQDSYQARLSLPLVRLLGIVKLRIAQVNTSIGIMKNSLKLSSDNLIDPSKKIDKIVSTFLDAVTKQIDAQTNTYKQKMNRYEKSISILYSSLNMIHSACPEYAEAMVEIAKNRRLLAVNKKHLRGQWRQDAIDVDKVNLRQIQLDEQKDRKDQLEEKGLNGEVTDMFVDYKEEALKTFVDLLESKTEVKLVERLSGQTLDAALSTFALEYAECRGNLNKEQSFFYLALYQYAVSRQFLFDIYLKAANEKHPDILRLRQLEFIRKNFQNYTSPVLPKYYAKTEEDVKETSKPLKLLTSFSTIEELKDGLPSQTAFLILQLSEDKQHLYYGLLYITKERRFNYYVSKISFSDFMREKLGQLVDRLAQIKISMQKTPITIEEDLIKLEIESERDVTQLINELESYFEPMSANLDQIINPPPKVAEEEDPALQQQQLAAKGGAPPKKDDKKAPPPKAPAGKPAAGGKGGPGELAAYESNLPLPTSGIESLILLVDHRIESLPFETLKVFSKIPVISRDFNLHLHMQRLKSIGHQALIHNNTGIQKENLRYIFDSPQPIEEKCNSFMSNDLPKLLPTAKWDGLMTRQHHVPSQGEWQRLISQSSLFVYYSMTSLVHKFPPSFVSDLSIFSKCRAMIIMDRMNTFKTLIDRNILTSQHYVPNEQPTHQAALFSLCGVSSIVTNNWAIKPEASIDAFQMLLRGALAEGTYLGAALRKYRANGASSEEVEAANPTAYNPDKKLIYRANMVTYGVPIIRVV